MAIKQPTPVSFLEAIRLCVLAIVSPSKFDELEHENSKILETQPNFSPAQRVLVVRRALFFSFILVALSGAIGFISGSLSCYFLGPSEFWILTFQIIGAMLLLWATLAVRGWDILTYASVTLTERVNQWIYRTLYCIGTAILVMTLGWTSCG